MVKLKWPLKELEKDFFFYYFIYLFIFILFYFVLFYFIFFLWFSITYAEVEIRVKGYFHGSHNDYLKTCMINSHSLHYKIYLKMPLASVVSYGELIITLTLYWKKKGKKPAEKILSLKSPYWNKCDSFLRSACICVWFTNIINQSIINTWRGKLTVYIQHCMSRYLGMHTDLNTIQIYRILLYGS